MASQTKVTGVILAGGLARRMSGQDKGLIPFRGKALVSYAIDAMCAVADRTIINANRNLADYRQFGLPVVSDQTDTFDGPLAGILTGMIYADTGIVLTIPCDSPFFDDKAIKRLLDALIKNAADVAVASEGVRLHPVFMAVSAALRPELQFYLQQGHRKVEDWLRTQKTVMVDFSGIPDVFININTMAELSGLEARQEPSNHASSFDLNQQ